MAATNITFEDKILGQANALPENKKLTFINANEIKSVVNNNATELTTTQGTVATNTTDIAANLSSINTNTTNIATNTSGIATNASNIAANTSALDLKANLTGATFTGDVTAPDFIGNLNGAIRFTAKNASGSTLLKGKVVAITGVSGNETLVGLADADNVSARPAFGLVFANANNNAACEVVTFGNLTGLNTSAFTEGDTLYVSTVAGELVNVAPTGEAADIQNIGKVIRTHATEGIIKVGGAGRANATPNLNSGKMFLGNAANKSVSVAMSGDVTIDNTGVTTVGTINSVPVATITSDIATNTSNITTNTSNISTNVTNIATNASGIATNATNIATNTSNISTNASNISTNTSNISTNVTNIATNASGIATNAANIATNAGDISTNASNIETNVLNIDTNTSNISTNASNIATNVTAISNRIEKNIGATYTTNALTTLTQAEYDAIDTPDATTIYFIV